MALWKRQLRKRQQGPGLKKAVTEKTSLNIQGPLFIVYIQVQRAVGITLVFAIKSHQNCTLDLKTRNYKDCNIQKQEWWNR
jgi:hypothetical protein